MALTLNIDAKQSPPNQRRVCSTWRGDRSRDSVALPSSADRAVRSCRLCLVEVTKTAASGSRRRATSSIGRHRSAHPDEEIKRHRRVVLDLLLGLAPTSKKIKDSPSCTAFRNRGSKPVRRQPVAKIAFSAASARASVKMFVGASAIALAGRGDKRRIDVPFIEQVASSCIGCGACAAVCPTEAIDFESIKKKC